MYLENRNKTPRSLTLLLCLKGSPFLILWRMRKGLRSEGQSHTSGRPDLNAVGELNIRNLACGLGCSATGSLWTSQLFPSLADTQSPGELFRFPSGIWPLGLGEAWNLYFNTTFLEVLWACHKWFSNPNHGSLLCKILIAGVTSQICEENSRGCQGKLGKLGRL